MQERVLWLLASVAGAILLVAGLWPDTQSQSAAIAPSVQPKLDISLRGSVLNGCGVAQVAARMTKRVRSVGLDVIHEGNADSFGFLQTIVIDRSGNPEMARKVAALLGVPHVIQQISGDAYRLEDVSIIIGKDYDRLGLLD